MNPGTPSDPSPQEASAPRKNPDPLHGVTLERLLKELVAAFGWRELAKRVEIRCFMFDPSVTSSLKFLRKNPWARAEVEALWVSWQAGVAARRKGGKAVT